MDKEAIIAKIYEQIETVFDPEIPVDINALGLIYKPCGGIAANGSTGKSHECRGRRRCRFKSGLRPSVVKR